MELPSQFSKRRKIYRYSSKRHNIPVPVNINGQRTICYIANDTNISLQSYQLDTNDEMEFIGYDILATEVDENSGTDTVNLSPTTDEEVVSDVQCTELDNEEKFLTWLSSVRNQKSNTRSIFANANDLQFRHQMNISNPCSINLEDDLLYVTFLNSTICLRISGYIYATTIVNYGLYITPC
jgi:hypothetical protein